MAGDATSDYVDYTAWDWMSLSEVAASGTLPDSAYS